MRWVDILADVRTLEAVSGLAVEVSGVQYDSRRVGAGDVFVAMRGESADGNQFVDRAREQGATAVVTDSRATYDSLRGFGLGVALVAIGRRGLSEVSAAVFGHPERALTLSAVTGTNGKTTTAWLLEQMLRSVGRNSVLVGTIETHVAGEVRASPHTTPESRDLLRTFADGVAMGCTEAVIEASSHALEQERVWGMPVDVAIWTNLTQDHLDYHGTMEAYFAAKAKLFTGVGTQAPRVVVVNADDAFGERVEDMARAAGSEVWRYGMGVKGGFGPEFRAERVKLAAGETRFELKTSFGTVPIRSPLTGVVNVSNLLATMCAALARGVPLEEIAASAERLSQVPGRFQIVTSTVTDISVVVDYAHTDDALRNLIALARDLVRARGGRVITVFGCGGDRDKTKRPKMGRAAGEGSDLVVVTSDNPRTEDPRTIIEEVMVGVRATAADVIVEEDRAGAIAIAIRAARMGDVVLIAGKGHERVQIFADGTLPFDDVLVARDVLREIGAE